MLVRSVVGEDSKIGEIMKLMKADLDVVTSEGAVIQTNQFLMSQCSPFLKNLFSGEMSSPARLHLPEISAVPLSHLINIVKMGYTTGQGTGDYVVKEIKIAAKVLGFEKFPTLKFIVGRNPTSISSETVQEFIERAPVQSDRIENGDDDIIVELEDDQDNISQNPQDLESRDQSGLNTDDQPMVSIIRNILQDMDISTNEDGGTSQMNKEVTGNIIYSNEKGQIKLTKRMIKVRPLETPSKSVLWPNQTYQTNDQSPSVQETGSIIYSSGNKRNKPSSSYAKQIIQVYPLETNQILVHPQTAPTSDKDTASKSINKTVKTNGMDSNGNHEAPNSTSMELAGTCKNKRKQKILSIPSNTTHDDEIPMIEDLRCSGSGWMRMYNQIKKKCRVEILKQTNHLSQEVTEITPNVLKVEPGAEDQGNQTEIHCGICRKAFTNGGSLLSHSIKHDKYSCTMCRFKGPRNAMLIHIRSKHTKEKLFHCIFCPKSFSSCTLKNSHQRGQHKAEMKK